MKNPLSIIILSDKIKHSPALSEFADIPVYVLPCIDGVNASQSIHYVRTVEGQTQDIKEINSSSVLFLEEGEFLKPKEKSKLLRHLKKNNDIITKINVERFVPHEELEKYAWVTTRNAFKKPLIEMKRYFTSEARLVPCSYIKDVRIVRSLIDGEKNRFALEFPGQFNAYTDSYIIISRCANALSDSEEEEKPRDYDIFKHGHQKYFDDTVYSPRFGWPHTVYQTIRLDHVPSIIDALKADLSNPDIILFTLVYLIRFNHFSKASEVINLIPDHWYERHPALLNVVATLHFINGNSEKSVSLFQYALDMFPDVDAIAQNAIKINILLNHHDAVDVVLRKFRDATGKELEDDYLFHFKAIHQGMPERTATVSLCMIVNNEEESIERAITSAKPMVDEIIVIDTGSSDNTATIAESLGAKVYKYLWNDDFSAARNFAISKATCNYIFMLDGDEYIPTFYFIECQTFKRLLPLNNPCAFDLSIGSYFNETDWLFIVSETGNFRPETTSVRIFPRVADIQYRGCIGEAIEPSLLGNGIPIKVIPNTMFHILHDTGDRCKRIERKRHIFKKVEQPDYSLILTAIKEFSFLGEEEETLQWLKHFYDNYRNSDASKLKMGLHLAKLLETREPTRAEQFYQQLINLYPGSTSALLAYAEYLITSNRLDKIRYISFDHDLNGIERTKKEEIELECVISLKHFEAGELERAFHILANVLEENSYHIFAQSLRFYYLTRMNEIEGSLLTLDTLFTLLHCRKQFKIDEIEDFIHAGEELCDALLQNSYFKERALILHGIVTFGKQWEKQ